MDDQKKGANTTPFVTAKGPGAIVPSGVATDHKMVPFLASIATYPPPVVTTLEGMSVKFTCSLFIEFMKTSVPSVAAPHIVPPVTPPGPAT